MIKHGLSKHELYPVWIGMRQRCNDPNHISYKNYGAIGVTVCERWDNFELFLLDMGERPEGDFSIDRIDGSKGYEPSNCKWASRKEQNRNKRNSMTATYKGVTKTLQEWSAEVGIKFTTLRRRQGLGWDVEKMLFTKPVIGRNQTWSNS